MFFIRSFFFIDLIICLDYDLVRLYHPDKVISSSASSTAAADDAHARFQAIAAAYDMLRGKTPLGVCSATSGTAETVHPSTAAYRTMQRRRQELYENGAVDDSRLDRWLIAGVVAVRFPRFSAQLDLMEILLSFFVFVLGNKDGAFRHDA